MWIHVVFLSLEFEFVMVYIYTNTLYRWVLQPFVCLALFCNMNRLPTDCVYK